MRNSFLFTLLIVFLSFNLNAQKRAMTTDDGLNMTRLQGAFISPDGNHIVYGKSDLNWTKNKRTSKYYHILPDGSDNYQFLGKDGGGSMQFSPDGKYISLRRTVDKKSQLFLLRTSGGEAVQLSKHSESVRAYRWSPDGTKIYFLANKKLSKEAQKAKKEGYDHVVVDEGPNGQRAAEWTHLFVIDIASKKIEPLLKKDVLIRGMEVSPDGKHIAYTARTENRRNQGNKSEIFLYHLADDSITQLTKNKAPEGGLAWSPDSKLVSFTAADDQNWELKNGKIWTVDVSTKKIQLHSGKFEGNLRGYYWAPDGKSIYFNGQQGVNSNVYRLDLASGNYENISKQTGTWRILGMDKNRSNMILSFSDFDTPTDLYFSSTSSFQPKKLTDLNPWVEKDIELATMETMQWKSKDGLQIEGLLFQPKNTKSRKSPFLLHIHGGPAGVFSNSFSYRYHVWAGLGYVQLAPNVRGSSGYTDALLRGNMKDIGGGDYEDLMTGVDALIKKGVIDKKKLAVRGWSYGGILGGTVISKTNRFKAASLGAMVSDWRSEYGIGFNYDVRLWYIGGTFWENPKGYREKSALTYVEKVTTPLLLLHGDRDVTDTEAQSMMYFAALKDLGKTVRYLKFPREPHGFREPRHIRTRDLEEIKWIQKHTLGIDWKPWERKKSKEKEKKEEKK
jgi:dipeptidyl aminopeptidase/acylaminoacyl peptidase